MKTFLFLSLALFTACASGQSKGKYKEETNQPRFGNSRSYVETPDEVLLAAQAVLDELAQASVPPATGSIRKTANGVESPWIQSTSRNKYVEYKFNGTPRRKPLQVRHKYLYSVTPSLAGSQVMFSAEEEIMQIDLKSGKDKGWSKTKPDTAVYDMMARRLTEKLRSR